MVLYPTLPWSILPLFILLRRRILCRLLLLRNRHTLIYHNPTHTSTHTPYSNPYAVHTHNPTLFYSYTYLPTITLLYAAVRWRYAGRRWPTLLNCYLRYVNLVYSILPCTTLRRLYSDSTPPYSHSTLLYSTLVYSTLLYSYSTLLYSTIRSTRYPVHSYPTLLVPEL